MRFSLVLLLVFSSLISNSQTDSTSNKVTKVDMLSYKGWKTANRGMIVLSSWATVNMASGFFLSTQLEDTPKYFHQMNGMWNTVNFALGVAGYFTTRRKMHAFDKTKYPSELQRQVKILKFNSYLDIGYMAAGGAMWALNNQFQTPEMGKGYGISMIMQGAFLLVFDQILARRIQRNGLKPQVY